MERVKTVSEAVKELVGPLKMNDEIQATAFLYASAKQALKSLDAFTRSSLPANKEDIERTDLLREMVERYEKVLGL